MGKSDNPIQDLTPEQVNAIMERVAVIREALNQSEIVIDSAQRDEFDLGVEMSPPPNVVYIVPHIKTEYQNISVREMGIDELLRWFEKWTVDISGVVAGNIHHFKNKAVTEHVHQMLDICRIIDHASRVYFDR